jgi:2-keto-3-deoxy-L-rhamnonate aldolase RhmA
LTAAIETVIDSCTTHGVFPAIQMNDIARAVRWAKAGMRMVSISSEIGLLTDASGQAVRAVAAGFGKD